MNSIQLSCLLNSIQTMSHQFEFYPADVMTSAWSLGSAIHVPLSVFVCLMHCNQSWAEGHLAWTHFDWSLTRRILSWHITTLHHFCDVSVSFQWWGVARHTSTDIKGQALPEDNPHSERVPKFQLICHPGGFLEVWWLGRMARGSRQFAWSDRKAWKARPCRLAKVSSYDTNSLRKRLSKTRQCQKLDAALSVWPYSQVI